MSPTLRSTATAFALALALPFGAVATAQISSVNVIFPRGHSAESFSGTLVGSQVRDYVVRANAGQRIHVSLSGSPIVYFNVLPPGSRDTAIFIGSTSGNSYLETLRTSGAYRIRVYQMRATARRGERGNFRLAISVTGGSAMGAGWHPGGGQPGAGRPGGGLQGIAGMNSINAIDVMTSRGFRDVDSFESGNTQYGIFYNPSTRVCAQLTMANTRVVDARDIRTHPKCR